MRIESITADKKNKDLTLILLQDGRRLKAPAMEVVRLGLRAGDQLEQEDEAAITGAFKGMNARKTALNVLSYRAYSKKGLEKRLIDKGIPPAEAEASTDWLENIGLINDEEYAKSVAAHYSAKGYGAIGIRREMIRRGLSDETAGRILADVDPDESIEGFIEKKLRGRVPDQDDIRRLANALARRGHRWEDISRALRTIDPRNREDDF